MIRQQWLHLTFFHWRFDPAVIQRQLPEPFEVETFDGKAWVGIVPFLIQGRLDFPETNVRTYVRGPDGQTGVWFFSLDAASLLAVLGARSFYGLPYMLSRMSVDVRGNQVRYSSARILPSALATLDVVVETGETIPSDGPRDQFLIARYRLYTKLLGRIAYAEVEHEPYPLAEVRLLECRHTLFATTGPPETIHYSPGVSVRISRPRFISQLISRSSA